MNDTEIIRALECCAQIQRRCAECPAWNELNLCGSVVKSQALKLINLQKAEIEDLREIVFMDRSEAIKNLKAEAVKEFAERLKANILHKSYPMKLSAVGEIDKLLKKFTEGKEE